MDRSGEETDNCDIVEKIGVNTVVHADHDAGEDVGDYQGQHAFKQQPGQVPALFPFNQFPEFLTQ